MSNPLTTKLQHGAVLTEEDRRDLEGLIARSAHLAGREVFATEGEPAGIVRVLLSGWACRFKTVPGGSRQIIAFMLPGDHSTLPAGLGHAMTYGLCALTRCELAEIEERDLQALIGARPNVDRALRWSAATDEAILQEWLANIGRRPAERRIAHLLCELLVRLQIAGLATVDSFPLPLTQSTLGDALGLSPAHVNRTIQALRLRGLVFFENGRIDVASVARLQKFAGFNPRYLNLEPARSELSV